MTEIPLPKKSRKGIGGRPKGRLFTEAITLKLRTEDRAVLNWLCEHCDREASDLIRELLWREKAEIGKALEEKSD